jgi:hypothetical protein
VEVVRRSSPGCKARTLRVLTVQTVTGWRAPGAINSGEAIRSEWPFKTAESALIHWTSNGSSNHSTLLNPVAWAWGFQSVAQLLKVTGDGFGRLRTTVPAQPFNSIFEMSAESPLPEPNASSMSYTTISRIDFGTSPSREGEARGGGRSSR